MAQSRCRGFAAANYYRNVDEPIINSLDRIKRVFKKNTKGKPQRRIVVRKE